ncbi:chemokine XC receptor 1-like [Clarias gariepinus]|uniref:chemokine XC receptor 1-like n=1 Tax=Clarias gariepinus TaxID=13013 RepID=UPI00234D884B|nr:chemokine XC receptor 1-like [Clarias gariepinus]
MEYTEEYLYNYTGCFFGPYYDGFMVEDKPIEFPIILSIVVILSLFGNILVVVISVFYMRHRSQTIIFILNLALSDLLFTVGLVLTIYERMWYLPFGDAPCKVIFFVLSAGFYSSVVFLVLLSIHRYMAAMHPHASWKKGCCFTLILICAWVVSFLASVPVTVHTETMYYERGCMFRSKTTLDAIIHEHNIVFVCAFLVMSFCYIRILHNIFKSTTNQRHRTAGLAFILVSVFFICWAPFNIMIFLYTLPYDHIVLSSHFWYATYICHFLASSRCCVNPVIYGLLGLKFRETVREILERRGAFSSSQVTMVKLHSESCVSVNNQVPEPDKHSYIRDL